MTVTADSRVRNHFGNGITTEFNGPMAYVRSHIAAYSIVGGVSTKLPDASYDVAYLGRASGTRIRMQTAPAIGETLRLIREMPYAQEVDITNQSAFLPEVVEKGLDMPVMQIQQLADRQERALHYPEDYPGVIPDMRLPAPESTKLIGWNVAGDALRNNDVDINGAGDLMLRNDLADPTGGGQLVAYRLAATGSAQRTVYSKLAETVSAKDFGAIGNGTTDDYAAIQAALNNAPGGSTVMLPPGNYRVSAGLIVPAGKGLAGTTEGDAATGARTQITGDLAVAAIVTLNGGVASESTGIRNVNIGRAAGTIPANCAGLVVTSTDNPVVEDVTIYRQAYGWKITGQLGINFNRVNTTQITRAHGFLQTTVEATFLNCRFGRNGGQDLACFTIIEIDGVSVDTVNFIRCQFNQSGNMAVRGVYFNNYTNPNGIFNFIGCHIENISAAFIASNASTTIDRVNMTACTVHLTTTTPLISAAAATVHELTISGCSSLDASLTLDQATRFRVVGNTILGPVIISGGNGVFSNNVVGGDLTINGVATGLAVSGNSFYNGGTVLDTSTGTKSVYGNASSVESVTLELVNSLQGRYVKLGDNIPFAFKRVIGTTDASGVAILVHGIPNGNLAILNVQAFYRGASGELRPMTFEFSGANDLRVSGGTATVACRVDIMYTNPANRQNW